PVLLLLSAEHPQHQHIDQDMANAAMQKGIRQELPNHPIVDYQTRHQARIEFEIPPAKRQEGAKQDLQKINNDAGDADALPPYGLEVGLHRTSYPEARGDLSQVNVESFSSSLVSR